MEARRLEVTRQAIINITEEALWNLMSACSNTGMQLTTNFRPNIVYTDTPRCNAFFQCSLTA